MGRQEAVDAGAAVDYAAARLPGARIGLIGFSMGATIAILTASDNRRVRALVLDSPFEDPDRLILSRLGSLFPLTRGLLLPALTRLWGKILFRSDIGGLDVPAHARRLDVARALVVVSGRDSVIPPTQQRALYDALTCPRELWEEPDVDHCGAYFRDRGAYIRRVVDFFLKTLPTD